LDLCEQNISYLSIHNNVSKRTWGLAFFAVLFGRISRYIALSNGSYQQFIHSKQSRFCGKQSFQTATTNLFEIWVMAHFFLLLDETLNTTNKNGESTITNKTT